jgi:hypothetical protein
VIVGGGNHTVAPSGSGPDYSYVGIFAGQGNTIQGAYISECVIIGGQGNTINGTPSTPGDAHVYGSAIVGGINNTITGQSVNIGKTYGAFIGGGKNNYIGGFSYVASCFGYGNTIKADASDYGAPTCLVAGKNNYISGLATSGGLTGNDCVAFGRNNTIKGAQAAAVFVDGNYVGGPSPAYASCSLTGGKNNTNRSYASILWGQDNSTHSRAQHSAVFGQGAYVFSAQAFVFGAGGTLGSAQTCLYCRSLNTTTATPLGLGGVGVPRIFLPANRTFGFRMTVTARQYAGVAGTIGDSAMWTITGMIKRDGANNTVLVGVPTGTGTPSAFNDAGAATWNVAVTADDVNEALQITVTGEASKSIMWNIAVYDAEAG